MTFPLRQRRLGIGHTGQATGLHPADVVGHPLGLFALGRRLRCGVLLG
jgi:hypothetical protein